MQNNLEQWRYRAVAAAHHALAMCIDEDTETGRRWIAENVIAPVWGEDKGDRFVKDRMTHQYCCDFVSTWCWRQAGFKPDWNLASPGRMVYPFAKYQTNAMGGPHYCAVTVPKKGHVALSVRDLHAADGEMRRVLPVHDALPGDCLIHWTHDDDPHDTLTGKGWGGHGMLVVGVTDSHIAVVEGNSGYSMGPNVEPYHTGKLGCDMTRRQGIGYRVFEFDDPYLDCAVGPSPLDFDPTIRYFDTMQAAQEFAAGA